MPNLKQLGRNLKTRRKHLRLTQECLGEKINLHYTYIGHIEKGRKSPSLETLVKLSKGLDTSLIILLKGV